MIEGNPFRHPWGILFIESNIAVNSQSVHHLLVSDSENNAIEVEREKVRMRSARWQAPKPCFPSSTHYTESLFVLYSLKGTLLADGSPESFHLKHATDFPLFTPPASIVGDYQRGVRPHHLPPLFSRFRLFVQSRATHLTPQDWLFCHLGKFEFEFEFE